MIYYVYNIQFPEFVKPFRHLRAGVVLIFNLCVFCRILLEFGNYELPSSY